MIHPDGLFDHRFVIRCGADGWQGSATAPSRECGLVGHQPDITLRDGVMTIRPRSMTGGRTIEIDVGSAIETVLHDDDVLTVCRHGTGDLAIAIHRAGGLVIGLGAVDAPAGMSVTVDPRVHDDEVHAVVRLMDECGWRLVWLDADLSEEESLGALAGFQADDTLTMVAVRGSDDGACHRLHTRAAELLSSTRRSFAFYRVSSRFTTPGQWLGYGRSLSGPYPPDPFLRFTMAGEAVDLHEGSWAVLGDWHCFVRRVYRPGIPGQFSHIAIARADSRLALGTIETSVACIATGYLRGLF